MLILKNIIVYFLLAIFVYLVYEYFFKLSPKIIETFENSFDPTKNINLSINQVGDIKLFEKAIEELQERVEMSNRKLEALSKKLGLSITE